MITIKKNREVSAPLDMVWDVISNMDNEQKYWTSLKNIKVLNRNGNTIEREVTITRGKFGNAKSLQTVIIDPKEKSITVNMPKGTVGTRKITLDSLGEDKTKIEVAYEFSRIEGVPWFAKSFVTSGISKATEEALAKIAEDAERMQRSPNPQSEGI